jgi:hypothetical protein
MYLSRYNSGWFCHTWLERRHGGAGVWGELGGAEVAEGGRKGVAMAKKELGRPRRAGRPCNGCRASRGFVAGRPNRGSGGLLKGSRRGAEPACGSGRVRRGEEGPGAGERPGRSGGEAERGVRKKEKKMTGGPGGSQGRERGGRLLAWAGASARPRREGGKKKAGARRPLGRGKERWPGRARVIEERGEWAAQGGERRSGPWVIGLLAGLLLYSSFPFSFFNSNSKLLNSNKFESNPNHTIK